jgi:ABC-type multidrug transport system ATPase subunit
VGRDPAAARAQLAVVPQHNNLDRALTPRQNLVYHATYHGVRRREAQARAAELLERFGLTERADRRIEAYSGGMAQRLMIARALTHEPTVLFLDEPTNALDPPARERMLRHIQEIRDQGSASIILSSHLLRDVERCCDEVLVLKDGRIAAYRDLVAERRSNRKFLEIELKGDDDDGFLAAMRRQGAECAPAPRRGRNRFKMVLPEGLEVAHLYREAAERRVQIRRLSYKRDSLEEIFLAAMETGSPAEGTTDGTA